MATFFPWYHPRTIVLAVLFGAGWFYLMPSDPQELISVISLHKLSASQMRCLFLATFFVPTWLEARTLGFLSQVMCQAGWGYNFCVTIVIGAILFYRRTTRPLLPPRQHYLASIYILYGSALWVSLLHFNISNIPSTAGPFLLSSGTLLLSRANQGQYTVALRHAMRLTLRDTLATLSDNVQQDEMLQLAMLRWIVDYWSTRPEQATSSSASAAPARPPSPAAQPPSRVVKSGRLLESRTESRPPSDGSRRPETTRSQRRNRRQLTNGQEIQWSDLMPMLDMTTNQMEDEVRHSPESEDNESVNNLRQMLSTMELDEQARPAVDTYKQYIQDFPPSRDTALYVSVARRCPASLLIIWRYMIASALALPSTLTLLPFVFIEVERIMGWAKSCHQSVATDAQEPTRLSFSVKTVTSIPAQIDSMTLLFSPDRYSPLRPPTLLQVWFNIRGSVRALETGLTAARCAHTTAVAADFADNLMSLAQLGFEVSQKGWMHGLGIMTKELIHLHSTAQDGQYTTAAKSAIRNSQAISRNVQVLVEEDAPIVGFLHTIVGRGWLWGQEHSEPPIPKSTVTITEITDGEEEETPVEQEVIDETKPVVETVSEQQVKEALKLAVSARDRDFISKREKESFTSILRNNPDKSSFEAIQRSLTMVVEQGEEREKEEQRQVDELSQVKEMMTRAHDLGLIGEVQKISFEAILERQPSKSAILKATLTSILEKEEPSPTESQPKSTERIEGARGLAVGETEQPLLSETRQLKAQQGASPSSQIAALVAMVSQLRGRGMISEEEKKSFVDLLTTEPQDVAVVESVKKTLTGLLEESKERSMKKTGRVAEAISGSPESPALTAEPVAAQTTDTEDLPAIYSNSSWEETSQADNDSKTDSLMAPSWEAKTSHRIQPAESTTLSPEVARRLQLDSDEVPTADNDDEDNGLAKLFGGGLAILGAVVGTVAMHHVNQKGDQHRKNQTGRVVELSSEVDDDDGWVSVADDS